MRLLGIPRGPSGLAPSRGGARGGPGSPEGLALTPHVWAPADAWRLSRQGVRVLTAFLKRQDFQTGRRNRGPVERSAPRRRGLTIPWAPQERLVTRRGCCSVCSPPRPRPTGPGPRGTEDPGKGADAQPSCLVPLPWVPSGLSPGGLGPGPAPAPSRAPSVMPEGGFSPGGLRGLWDEEVTGSWQTRVGFS